MTYAININLGGLDFSVQAEDLNGLLDEYTHLGGDRQWLLSKVKETIPQAQQGVTTTIPQARAEEPDEDEGQGVDGPWDAPGGSERPATTPKVDPWDNSPIEDRKPSGRRSAPGRGSQPQAPRGTVVDKDRFGNEWTLGLPEAPECECMDPEPAGRIKGVSKQGKRYTAWKCAKGAPGGDWRNKCDFYQYAN